VFAGRVPSKYETTDAYPNEEAPNNVEVHIKASDAARQEVRSLQGSVTQDTSAKKAATKASTAKFNALVAQEEHLAALKLEKD
jgi:hypothetical protein